MISQLGMEYKHHSEKKNIVNQQMMREKLPADNSGDVLYTPIHYQLDAPNRFVQHSSEFVHK